ncbi:BMA-ROP-1 [Dirofilaria immitis]|nr:BMA-ROP-1 [Dirofilaria immitis]
MNIIEYLSSSHLDDARCRLDIAFAVRTLEQQNELVTDVVIARDQPFVAWRSDEEYVRRFLMLGNADGIYFARQKESCSEKEPLLIALALCARYKVRDTQSKKKLPWETAEEREKLFPDAACRDIRPVMENSYQRCLQQSALFSVHKVCLTPIHLFMFINYCKVVSKLSGLKKDSNGWGRALRATIIKWYYNQTPNRLAVMVTKYRHRVSYSHRDLFCLSHIHPKQNFLTQHSYWQHQKEYENILAYVVGGNEKTRKRRQELLLERRAKRHRLNPEEAERVRQNLEKLNLERDKTSKASEDVEVTTNEVMNAIKYIEAFEELQNSTSANIDKAINLILKYGKYLLCLIGSLKFIVLNCFEKEQIPLGLLNSEKVWGALLRRMSLRTMLQNMSRMSGENQRHLNTVAIDKNVNIALILRYVCNFSFNYLSDVLSNITSDDPASLVARRLNDTEKLKQERFHPLTILFAKMNYEYGYKMRGNRIWKPVKSIQKAFDNAFYNCFSVVETTNKQYLIAVDISDSMDSFMQGTMVACSQAAATISMALIQHEVNVSNPISFSNFLAPLEWNKCMSLGEYLSATKKLRYDKTDCALPMCWAIENAVRVDVFIILTDNDVSVKSMKPSDAIQLYRQQMGIPNAKLIVVGMTDKSGSLANPNDPNMLVICGMNPSVPQMIHDFVLDFQANSLIMQYSCARYVML